MAVYGEKEKEECKKIYEEICEVIDKTGEKHSKTFYDSLINEWFENYCDAEYLSCEVNKCGHVVVALYHNKAIYLLGENYKTIMYAPKIVFGVFDNGHLHIDDVLMKTDNVGNGSIAMRALLKYSKWHNIKKITGFLSSVDDNHKARRNHYYEKFGFSICESKIVLKL